MSARATALKEAFEESGLHVELTGYAGDVKRTTGSSRYYYAKRVGGTPMDAGWESEAVTLAHPGDLKGFLNHPIDHGIVDKYITPKLAKAAWEDEPRDEQGKWTTGGGGGGAEGSRRHTGADRAPRRAASGSKASSSTVPTKPRT